MDDRFRVGRINQSPNPQTVIWAAMHQDYSEGYVLDELVVNLFDDRQIVHPTLTETECGELVVKHLLNGNRGHYGPLEHPQIVLNIGWFPHSCMQQIRTHRVGISFDCQSGRYTGARIVDAAVGNRDIEEVFYLRPVGHYTNRQGKKYEYTAAQRSADIEWCREAALRYKQRLDEGFAEEHARSTIPFDVRQHWVMSANVRSLMHLLDLRAKADAQLECQQMCELIWPHFEAWVPEIAEWYHKQRWAKAKLAP